MLALGTVIPVIAGVKSVASDGWSTHAVLYAVAGVLVGLAFVRRQLTAEVPMLDVRALTERRFGGSVVVNVLAMFAIMGNAVILTQYLQSVLGFSPLAAALWSLVPSVVVGAAAPVSAMLAPRLGRPVVMAGGFAVSVVGFVMISRVDEASALWLVLLAAGLVSGGLVAVLSLITDYVVGVAPAERAGSVAGLVETLERARWRTGPGAARKCPRGGLPDPGRPPDARRTAGAGRGGGGPDPGAERSRSLRSLPAALGQAVMEAGRAAYTAAMHTAGLTAAGVLVLAAVVTLVMLRGDDRQPVAADAVSVDA